MIADILSMIRHIFPAVPTIFQPIAPATIVLGVSIVFLAVPNILPNVALLFPPVSSIFQAILSTLRPTTFLRRLRERRLRHRNDPNDHQPGQHPSHEMTLLL
jgi:hypothetical protein